jgi:ChrR Cupin-like domain
MQLTVGKIRSVPLRTAEPPAVRGHAHIAGGVVEEIKLTMSVQWDAGHRMGMVEHHEYDEHLYIIAGTFVDERRASGPGTYILNRAGSEHRAYTPDGCTFLEAVAGRLP